MNIGLRVWAGAGLVYRYKNTAYCQSYCIHIVYCKHIVYRTSDLGLDELTWEKEPFLKIIESDRRVPNVVGYEISRERRKFAFLIQTMDN